MKIKNFILTAITALLLFTLNTTAQTNHAPVVSNVTAVQRTDGSMKVDITYDVSDTENDTLTITMEVSSDGGTTWDYAATQVTGDIGENITPGTGKTIVWDFYAEHPEIYGENFKFRITADDGVFTCGTSTVNYAGKTYHTVQIGNQCWLKENLDVGTMINGADNQTNNGTIEKYCYNNDASNCETYGGLYEWNETMQYVTTESAQGICPEGWHIPTNAEYEALSNTVGGSGNALKAVGQGSGSGAGTNTSGFSALLAGNRYSGGYFDDLGNRTYFWSSTETSSSYAYYIILNYNNDNVYFNNYYKVYGFSVRCIKD